MLLLEQNIIKKEWMNKTVPKLKKEFKTRNNKSIKSRLLLIARYIIRKKKTKYQTFTTLFYKKAIEKKKTPKNL